MDCPECGAPAGECESRYHECLVKEFSEPGYGAVHHLTVSAYMLQHSSRLTREGWLYERELLREFLVEKKSPAFIRKQNRDVLDSGKRNFRIKPKTGEPVIVKIMWTKTILDIRAEDATVYCADVREWASNVLKNIEGLTI